MRNPIRWKNLRARFLPLYAIAIAIVLWQPPVRETLFWGLPLIVVGAGLRGWGAGHLVKNDALTLTGPYAYLRHPLYGGTILIGTGFALAVGGWHGAAILLAFWPWFALRYFPRKERIECARLELLYGDRFSCYQQAVPALWPRMRAWREDPGGEGAQPAESRVWALDRYSDNNELGTLLAVVVAWVVLWTRAGIGLA